MSHETIRSIFDTVINDWAKLNNIPIAFRNVNFKPPNDKPYIKVYTLPASTDSDDLEGKLRSYIGVYQISVIGQAGMGVGDLTEITEQLPRLFPLYKEFNEGEFSVQPITPVEEAKPIQTDTTYTIPLSFQYRADIFL